jgi:hypothetical protein
MGWQQFPADIRTSAQGGVPALLTEQAGDCNVRFRWGAGVLVARFDHQRNANRLAADSHLAFDITLDETDCLRPPAGAFRIVLIDLPK